MKREGGTTRLGVILTAALGLIAGLLVTVTTPVGSAVAAQPVSDDFADGDYDGGTNWDGDWDEFGDGTDSPTTGTIQVVSQQLRFQGIGSDFIQRDVDLSDFAGAELSVDLVSESGNEDLELQLDDGTSFVRLGDIGDGDAVGTKTFNIPASLQIDTTLRIVGEDTNWGSNEQVTIDNILISQEGRPPTNAQNNPDLDASCGTDVILVLDESGSVSSFESDVESAVQALVSGLKGTGSRLRIAEFSTNARDASIGGTTAFQTVDDAFETAVNTYLGNTGNAQLATNYNPGTGEQFTNWEAGLFQAAAPGSPVPTGTGTGAPLVVFITDGNPNTVGTGGGSDGGGTGNDAARDAAIEEMTTLQDADNHVLSIAVGNAFTDDDAFNRLRNITEPNPDFRTEWTGPGDGALDIRNTDVLGVASFDALDEALRQVVFALCAPSLSITKLDDAGNPVIDDPTTPAVNDGWPFELTVSDLDGTDAPASNEPFVWVSPNDGATTAPDSAVARTNNAGVALFQWTPNSIDDPKPWSSTATFTETLPEGWLIDPITYDDSIQGYAPACGVQRLDTSTGSVSELDVDLVKEAPLGTPVPTDTVRFGFERNGAPFVIDKADIITCEVINIRPATITIEKDTTPNSSQDFDFTTTSPVDAPVPLPDDFTLDDDADGTLSNTETFQVTPGTYTVTEDDYRPNFELTGISCEQNAGNPTSGTDVATRTATITVGGGDDITCKFTNNTIPDPVVQVTKLASPDEFVEPAGDVTYSVSVSNPNGTTEPLTITALTDEITLNGGGTQTINLLTATAGTLVPGGEITATDCAALTLTVEDTPVGCSFTISYTGRNAGDDIDNTVKVTAQDRFLRTVMATADEEVDVTPDTPSILVTKENVGPDVVAPGGEVSYTVTVENTSLNEIIELTEVTDQLFVNDVAFGSALNIAVQDGTVITSTDCDTLLLGVFLNPGASTSCEFTVDTTQVPGSGNLAQDDVLKNFVEVTGEDDDPTPTIVKDDSEVERDVLGEPPSIGVEKDDDGAEILEPGDDVTYTVDITNLGTTETLTITKITDVVSFNGSEVGTITIENPGAGTTVVSTLPGAPGAELISTNCNALIGTSLAPGASTSCDIELSLPGNAGDNYTDVVTVNATDSTGDPVDNSDDDSTPVKNVDPDIDITKTANPTAVPESGGLVTFTLDIVNTSTSSTDPLTLTTLSDSIYDDLFDPSNPDVSNNNCPALLTRNPLLPGESDSCSFQAIVSGDFGGPDHVNVATVVGVDDEDRPATDNDDAEVTFTDDLPTITVLKTADPTSVPESGAPVKYSVLVTNTGPEDVIITSLTDDMFGDITQVQGDITGTTCSLGASLQANGGTYPCDFTANVKQENTETSHTNVVMAEAQDDDDNTAKAEEPETVTFELKEPEVVITKDDDEAFVNEPGGNVTYELTIENTSFEPVTITTLTDTITYEIPAVTVGPLNLLLENPGAPVIDGTNTCHLDVSLAAADGQAGTGEDQVTCEFQVALAGTSQVVNDVARVIVTDNDGQTDDKEAEEDTPIRDVPPTVSIVKTADPIRIEPGQSVEYTFVITNLSTIEPLTLVKLEDDKFGDITTECGLAGQAVTLDPAGGQNDSFTCVINRSPITNPPGLADFDHINVATISAGDDEIIRSQGGDDELPFVTASDDAKVEIREKGTITAKKIAFGDPLIDFTFNLGQDSETVSPDAQTNTYPDAVFDGLDAGEYDLTETVPSGWLLSPNIVCMDGATGEPVDQITDGVKIDLDWGDDIECTFVNTKLGDLSVVKTIESGPTQQPGTDLYDVTYKIEITNSSFQAESINITDDLGIAGAVTVETLGTPVADPGTFLLDNTWTGEGAFTQLTDGDQTVAAQSTATITIPVTFRVPGETTTDRICASPLGSADGGALNGGEFDSSRNDGEFFVCENFPPPAINWDKDVDGSATRDANGLWTVDYLVVVENTGDGAGVYSLDDELRFGGSVDVKSVDAVVESVNGQTDPTPPAVGDADINPNFDGGVDDVTGDERVITDVEIVGGATHTYRITVTAEVPNPVVGDGACDPDGVEAGGFLNVADIEGATSQDPFACDPFSTLELIKQTPNTNGGNAVPTDFTLTATGDQDPATVVSGDGGFSEAVPAGNYELSETDVAGYTTQGFDCGNGFVGGVNVPEGGDVSCTIVNDDLPVDLELTKTDDGAIAVAGGDPFEYKVTVQNIGTRDVDAGEPVELTDVLPAGFSWVTIPNGCVQSDQVVTCTIPEADLGAGDSVEFLFTVRAAANVAGQTLTNQAYVDTEDDPVCVGDDCTPPPCPEIPNNNVDCEETPVDGDSTLTVVKEDDVADGDTVESGDSFNYTVTVQNNGPSVVNDVKLSDDLPDQLVLAGAPTGTDWTCSDAVTDPVTCDYVGALSPGEQTPAVTIPVTVVNDDVTSIDNTAVGTAVVETIDGPETVTDDDDEMTPVQPPADLELTKTDDGITAIAGGDPFEYTVTVTNVGDRDLDADEPVTVTDELPVGFSWVVNTLPAGCSALDQVVTCDVDPTLLDVDQSVELVFEVTAAADVAGQVLTNKAYVDTKDDPVCVGDDCQPPPCPEDGSDVVLDNNNVDCEPTPVDGQATLTVIKEDSLDNEETVVAGDSYSYEVTVTNNGPSVVDTVKLTDDLPVSLVLAGQPTGTDWTCNNADPIACDYANSLAPGETAPAVTIPVTVTEAAVDQIDNTAVGTAVVETVDGPETVEDDDTEVTPIEPVLDVGAFEPTCVGDFPYIQYEIVPKGFSSDGPATIEILDVNDNVITTLTNQPLSGQILWPGASLNPPDWPGWQLVNGVWVEDGTDQFLREGLFFRVTVNPTATTALVPYPSGEACADPDQTSADLQIEKTATNETPEQGESFNYDLLVTNNGPDLATEITVTDTVPSTLSVTGVSSEDFTCTATGNVVECDLAQLAAGATALIAIAVDVPEGTTGLINNVAEVDGRVDDPNPDNNTDDADVTVPTPAPLPPPPLPDQGVLPETGSNGIGDLMRMAGIVLIAGLALWLATSRKRRDELATS